ncbi:CRISPR-associated protein Cas2 [Methanococcus vannielii SB]|uniref:CRISPR-associated endoribonuclease Cas2 n=1 Tax=Methanococcus vannielii (strain ATCC 35089 / DSM 1224 / JCM 13029 / OCM 148 / SB) TaxID=406327 RepID=A6UNF6_METVS|nr:CRISPR-associated endonuclease Cas2 [Methanococcus vannielii]ABR54028.1 CRISPR-associated protein Cas2 [Methanococcus vannielii SB]
MIYFLIYDISGNKARNRVINYSKNIGLYRIQKSVFSGNTSIENINVLKEKIRKTIDLETDSVFIFGVSKDQMDKFEVIGQDFDRELINGEITTKFL